MKVIFKGARMGRILLGSLLLLVVSFADAQSTPVITSGCMPNGQTTEACGCNDQFGNPAYRVCYHYLPMGNNPRSSCSTKCEGCKCLSSGRAPSQVPGIPAYKDGEVEFILPARLPSGQTSVALQFCIGQYREKCSGGLSYQGCPQTTNRGDVHMARDLCERVGLPYFSTPRVTRNEPGNRCGYTHYAVTCTAEATADSYVSPSPQPIASVARPVAPARRSGEHFVIRFCQGQYEGPCPANIPAIACPQDGGMSADLYADGLCRNQGAARPYPVTVESNKGGHRCGYTVIAATCVTN